MALIIGHLAAVALVAGIALGASSCDDDGGNGGGTDPTPPSVSMVFGRAASMSRST